MEQITKINYMSDLHFESDKDFRVTNEGGADLLILAGDIFVAADLLRPRASSKYETAVAIRNFLTQVSKSYKYVIYIMGNHEHYHGIFSETAKLIRLTLDELGLKNIHFLDKEYIIIDGYLFFGATLWTDFNKGAGLNMYTAEHTMNDYHTISRNNKDYRKITSELILAEHTKSKSLLLEAVKLGMPTIVISHHAPSPQSIHPRYSNDIIINSFYHSDLESLITGNTNILAWFHGHTHSTFDYYVGGTRILTNPKGYMDENKNFDKYRSIDI